MIEQLNRINKRFGAHKFEILSISPVLKTYDIVIRFRINNFSEFALSKDGVLEYLDGYFQSTDRSRWLQGVANGLKRDDSGAFTAPSASPSADLNAAAQPNEDPQTASTER